MKNIPINEILKKKREEKGIGEEQVFYEAHIPSKFIHMIENGQWEKFPSKIQRKGFLRIYGEYLGIPSQVIEEGIRQIEEKERQKMDETEKSEEKISETKCAFKIDKHLLYITLLLFIFLAVLYILVLYLLPE